MIVATGRPAVRACCLLVLWLAGCAVGPDFVRPAPPAVRQYTARPTPTQTVAAEGRTQRLRPGAPIRAAWWQLFGSPALDAAMTEALVHNANLEAARASLRRSEFALRAGYAVFFPQIDVGASVARQRFTPVRFGSNTPGSDFTLYTASTSVSYALDLFGAQRRAVEGLHAQVDVQRALADGVYLTLTANVISTFVARAAYREQVHALETLIRAQQEQRAIAQARATAGTAPYTDVLSLETQLAANQALLWSVEQRHAESEHLLATLTGRAPAEGAPPEVSLDGLVLPTELPLSLPADLVRQRPDILVAEAQLHMASADVGVATAALLPSLTLTGTIGVNATALATLFSSNSLFWSVGAGLLAPVFQGGRLWYQRRAALAALEQALASYRQVVLDALAQVANVLVALDHDSRALEAQSRALAAASEIVHLIDVNFRAGTASYLQVLVANAQYQQARLGHIQAIAQRLQDTAALYVALGGAWWSRSSSP